MKVLLFVIIAIFTLHFSIVKADWTAVYRGYFDGTNNEVNAIAVDNSGNVYVTGMCDPVLGGHGTNIATVMYLTSNGGQNWVARHIGNGYDDEDAGNSITTYTDNSNVTFVYVTGRTYNLLQTHYSNYVTIKYRSTDGGMEWTKTYNNSNDNFDNATHIEVDNAGDAYVTGQSYNGTDYDYVTIKYAASNGAQLWLARYNGGYGDDVASSLKVTGGVVYVTGTSPGNGTGNDIVTIAYDASNGSQLWLDRYNSGSSYNDIGNDIAADAYSGVYVTGKSGNNGLLTVIKYDNTGTRKWVYTYRNSVSEGKSIKLFRHNCVGNIYCYNIQAFVTGIYGGSGITTGLDESGNILTGWPQTYSSGSLVSLGIDASENVFVAGSTSSSYLTIKYNSHGTQQWANTYQYCPSCFNTGVGLAIDLSGNCCVTGSSNTQSPHPVYYVTLQYAAGADHMSMNNPDNNTITPVVPKEYALKQNYPNPFNPATEINYAIPNPGYVNISVYNVLGKKVAEIVNEYKEAGYNNISFDGSNLASGIYFYRIKSGVYIEQKKMVLIK